MEGSAWEWMLCQTSDWLNVFARTVFAQLLPFESCVPPGLVRVPHQRKHTPKTLEATEGSLSLIKLSGAVGEV